MENENQAEVSQVEGDALPGEATIPNAPETTAPETGLTEAQIRQIDDLFAKREESIAQKSAKAYRAMQSLADTRARQIAVDAQNHLEAMKATGAQFTPEMEREYVNRTVNNYLTSLNDEQPAAAQPEPQRNDVKSQFLDAAMEEVNDFVAKNSVDLTPEARSALDAAWKKVSDAKSYTAFIKSIPEILQSKSPKTPPQVRMASVVGSGGSASPTAENYIKEVKANVGNREAIRAIEAKYRKDGLDVDHVKFSQGR